MKFFDSIKDALILGRKEDEALHAQVLREIESGFRRDGLWSKALANAGGSEERAKAEYIKLVVRDLRDQQFVENRVHDLAKEMSQSMIQPPQQPEPRRHGGGASNITELSYREQKNLVRSRRAEILSFIDAINKDKSAISAKDKATLIEMAGGLVRWNDPLDQSKGCKITFEGFERLFENSDSMEKWIDHIAVRRIQDYLLLK